MDLKMCVSCGNEYPVDNFPAAGIVKGKFYRRRKCQTCYWDVKKKRRCKIKEWLNGYKKTQNCEQCGESDFRVLDFHHLSNNKELEVSIMAQGHSVESILREINKCSVLCANCHRILHYEERNGA